MKDKQVKESELIIPALKIIYEKPNITTSELIKELQKMIELYPKDKMIIKNRKDTYFSQTVRNLCGSHIVTNEFGRCVDVKKENNINCFVINEYGLKKIKHNFANELEEITEDELYQNEIQSVSSYFNSDLDNSINRKPELKTNGNNKRYKTDPRIAKTAIEASEFICEYGKIIKEPHKTFKSKNGNYYMEGHHLIPMKAQKDYAINIDRPENIISLCPICHRAIHNACNPEKLKILKTLFEIREKKLESVGLKINFEDLYNKYYL